MRDQWIRLKTAVDTPLRRGAWYRVALLTGLEVTVAVDGRTVSVPRSFVEFRETPPREWTVLRRPSVPPLAQVILQNGYMVCPDCSTRLVLPPGRVREQLCARCGGIFPIAWDERYLDGATRRR